MTRRGTFTEAEIVRFGRAADKLGKVLVITREGAVFADPERVAFTAVETDRPNSCDLAWPATQATPEPW